MRTIGEQKWQQPWLTQWGDKKLGSSPFQPSRVGERERGNGLSGSEMGERREGVTNERRKKREERSLANEPALFVGEEARLFRAGRSFSPRWWAAKEGYD